MSLFSRFEAFELDVLKEVGNIGAGNAATALSRLLDKPVDMAVPKVSLLPFEEVAERVGGSEQIVLAVFLRVEGEAPGNMFFIIEEASARRILRQLLSMNIEEKDGYSEMELSALCEIGNILAGSYLSSLADFTAFNDGPIRSCYSSRYGRSRTELRFNAVRRDGGLGPSNRNDIFGRLPIT